MLQKKKQKKQKKKTQFHPQYYSNKITAYFCLTLESVVLEMQNSADQLEEKKKTKTIKKRIIQLTRKLKDYVPNLLNNLRNTVTIQRGRTAECK